MSKPSRHASRRWPYWRRMRRNIEASNAWTPALPMTSGSSRNAAWSGCGTAWPMPARAAQRQRSRARSRRTSMTQALNGWKERFADLIEAARHTDDLGDAERDQLIAFIAREALRILD